MTSEPATVIIPTFERPEHVRRALDSVLRQTTKAAEIIVIDDGSDRDYTAGLDRIDPSIRLVRLLQNSGPAAARNAGIRAARCDIICFLDDDDWYHPEYLEQVGRALGAGADETDLVWTGVSIEREVNGRRQRRVRDFAPRVRDRRSLYQSFLSIGLGHGVAVRHRCFESVGLFSEDLRLTEDAEWFLRFLARGHVPRPVPGALVTVQYHDDARLTDAERNGARRGECAQVAARMAEFLDEHPYLREMLANATGLSGMP